MGVGDVAWARVDGGVEPRRVVRVTRGAGGGLYAPHAGDDHLLVVDGVVASEFGNARAARDRRALTKVLLRLGRFLHGALSCEAYSRVATWGLETFRASPLDPAHAGGARPSVLPEGLPCPGAAA